MQGTLFDPWAFDKEEELKPNGGGNGRETAVMGVSVHGGNGHHGTGKKALGSSVVCVGGPCWPQRYADALRKAFEEGDLSRHDFYELRREHLETAQEKGLEVDL